MSEHKKYCTTRAKLDHGFVNICIRLTLLVFFFCQTHLANAIIESTTNNHHCCFFPPQESGYISLVLKCCCFFCMGAIISLPLIIQVLKYSDWTRQEPLPASWLTNVKPLTNNDSLTTRRSSSFRFIVDLVKPPPNSSVPRDGKGRYNSSYFLFKITYSVYLFHILTFWCNETKGLDGSLFTCAAKYLKTCLGLTCFI